MTKLSMLESTNRLIDKALKYSDVSPDVAHRIKVPNATYSINFGVRLRNKIHTFTGWRCVHSEHMEPVKGGIRYDLDANLEEVEALAASNFFHFTEHSATVTKSLISTTEQVRHESYAKYDAVSTDQLGRLLKKPEPDLTNLLYQKLVKEII